MDILECLCKMSYKKYLLAGDVAIPERTAKQYKLDEDTEDEDVVRKYEYFQKHNIFNLYFVYVILPCSGYIVVKHLKIINTISAVRKYFE